MSLFSESPPSKHLNVHFPTFLLSVFRDRPKFSHQKTFIFLGK